MEKMYRLKYQGKWMKVKKILGSCSHIYELLDNPSLIEPVGLLKAEAQRALVSDDNEELDFHKIEIVEV